MEKTMPERSVGARFAHNVRSRILTGLLVLIPAAITFLILQLLFKTMAGFLKPPLKLFLGSSPDIVLGLISVLCLLVIMYVTGQISTHFLGRRMIAMGERILTNIPGVKSIYSAAKQIVHMFSASDLKAVKRVVFVEFPRPGLWAIGFMTGVLKNPEGKSFCKVFIPTTPNPTSGFLEIVPAEEVQESDLSVEDAIKMIVSGGALSPGVMGFPSGRKEREPAPVNRGAIES